MNSFCSHPLVAFLFCAALTGCGDGESPAPEASQALLTEQAANVPANQFASTATSLQAPVAVEVPTLVSPPSAPSASPPPRRPLTKSTASAQSLRSEVLATAPPLVRKTIVSGLSAPTDLALTRDGVLFYTERTKGLYVQRKGQAAAALFVPSDLAASNSSGMWAVAVDPEFARNRFIFVFMKVMIHGVESSRVIRLTVNESITQVLDHRDIVVVPGEKTQASTKRNAAQRGGALRFGPDGYLYVGVANDSLVPVAQSPQLQRGKLLRVDRNGEAAPRNHAPAGFDQRIFAYGLQAPIALAFHDTTGTVLVAQRQDSLADDITLVKAGMNGSWIPCIAPQTEGCENGLKQTSTANPMVSVWRNGQMKTPVQGKEPLGPTEDGLSAIEQLRDPMWRDWRNAFVLALDQGQRLTLIKLDHEGRVVNEAAAFHKLGIGFKAVALGPDGLYVATRGHPGGEEIWRLVVE